MSLATSQRLAQAPAPLLVGEEASRARVLELVKRHGWNATSFQVLESEFRYFFAGDDACVAYVDTGRAWVVGGAPIAAEKQLGVLALEFAHAARANGRRAIFFGTEERFTRGAPLRHLRIGEQAHWDPRGWEETLRESASLREQLRRARAKGVIVRTLAPHELEDDAARGPIEALMQRWLASRAMAPMGFLVQLELFERAHERRWYVAEQHGSIVGFLGVVPVYARGGFLFEDLVRDPKAPNGTTDLLIDHAMRAAASEGARWASLGLAPLAGAVDSPLRAARRLGRGLFDFEGLRAFKARLRPTGWDPLYLSYPCECSAWRAVLDALTAFARGGLLRFGVATLLRRPIALLRRYIGQRSGTSTASSTRITTVSGVPARRKSENR